MARAQSASPSPLPSGAFPTTTPSASPGSNAVTFVDSWPDVNLTLGKSFAIGYYNVSSTQSRCERVQFLSFNSSATGTAKTLSFVVIPTNPGMQESCTLTISLATLAGVAVGQPFTASFTEAASTSPEEWATVDVSGAAWSLTRFARYRFQITTSTWATAVAGQPAQYCQIKAPFGTANRQYALLGSYGPPDTPCNPLATTYTNDPAVLYDGGSMLFSLEGIGALPAPSASASPTPTPSQSQSIGASSVPALSATPTSSPPSSPSQSVGASSIPAASPTPTQSGVPAASTSTAPSASASPSPTASPTSSQTPSTTLSPTASLSLGASPSQTASSSASASIGAAGNLGGTSTSGGGGGASAANGSSAALTAVAVVASLAAVAAFVYVRRVNSRMSKMAKLFSGKKKKGAAAGVSEWGPQGDGDDGGDEASDEGAKDRAQQAQIVQLLEQQQATLALLAQAQAQAQHQPVDVAADDGATPAGRDRRRAAAFAPLQTRTELSDTSSV